MQAAALQPLVGLGRLVAGCVPSLSVFLLERPPLCTYTTTSIPSAVYAHATLEALSQSPIEL